MDIFRLDGGRIGNSPSVGLKYFSTKELAVNYLLTNGYALETRTRDHSADHSHKYPSSIWYSNPLSEDGYAFDGTNYRIITEINVTE